MWILLLGLALAADPDDEPSPEEEAEELIPGVKNAGLPPPAENLLRPAVAGAPAEAAGSLPPPLQAADVQPPPPLPVHQGLPEGPPPIQEAGLPPMAKPLPVVHADTPGDATLILWEDLEQAEEAEEAEEAEDGD